MSDDTPSSKELFDVIVVGSGATGGWAAKELTEAGFRVAVVEAGRKLDPAQDFTEHVIPYQIKHRGYSPEIAKTRPIQVRCYACMEYNYDGLSTTTKTLTQRLRGKPKAFRPRRSLGWEI